MTTATARPYRDHLVGSGSSSELLPAVLLIGSLVVGASVLVNPVAPLALAAAAVFFLLARQRPVLGAAVVAGVVPALSGISRGLAGPLKLSEAVVVLATAAVLLQAPEWGRRVSTTDLGLAGFAAVGAVVATAHVLLGDSSVTSLLRFGLQPLLLLLTWYVCSRSVRSAGDLAVVLRTLLLVSVVPAAVALAQAAHVPGVEARLVTLTGSTLLTESDRVTGPFPIWHSLAAYLVVVVALGVALLLRRDQSVLPTPVLGGVTGLAATALLLTLTIAAVVWAVVAVLVIAARARRFGQAAALLAISLGVAGVLFSAPISSRWQEQSTTSVVAVNSSSTVVPQTIAYRISVWERDYVPLLGQAVPYGIANELPATAVFRHAENQYLLLLLRGGVPLLLAAVNALVLVGRDLRRAEGPAASAALGVLVFLPLAGLVWPYLSNAGLPQVLLGLAGAATAVRR